MNASKKTIGRRFIKDMKRELWLLKKMMFVYRVEPWLKKKGIIGYRRITPLGLCYCATYFGCRDFMTLRCTLAYVEACKKETFYHYWFERGEVEPRIKVLEWMIGYNKQAIELAKQSIILEK